MPIRSPFLLALLFSSLLCGGSSRTLAAELHPDENPGAPLDGATHPRETSPARWIELAPPARAEHCGVYDERRHRLVAFGGWLGSFKPRADVWTLELPGRSQWRRLEPEGTGPSARIGAAATYDAERDRMLVIGGIDSSGARCDVWELSLAGRGRWRELHPIGARPSSRARHTAILDPAHRRVFVFGGAGNGGELATDELWSLSLGAIPAWTRWDVSGGPLPRQGHVAVYASGHDGMLVTGGSGSVDRRSVGFSETWFLSTLGAPAWIDLTPRIGHPASRPASDGASAAWDAAGEQMIVIGGHDYGPCSPLPCAPRSGGRVSLLSLRDSTWSRPSIPGGEPPALDRSVAIWVPEQRALLLHGGESDRLGSDPPLADTWRLSLDTLSWSRVLPTRVPAFDRDANLGPSATVFDEGARRLFRYTGAETQVCALDGDREWRTLDVDGPSPPGRIGALVLLDPEGPRMLVCGGHDRLVPTPGADLGDAWALSLRGRPSWRRLIASDPALHLLNACGVFDPVRTRIVGLGAAENMGSNVWTLALDRPLWVELSNVVPDGANAYRPAVDASAILDARRDELVRFGGADFSGGALNETWRLSLVEPPQWHRVNANVYSPALPRPRAHHAAVYDPERDRMIVAGGSTPLGLSGLSDESLWALDLATLTWSRIGTTGGPIPTWDRPNVGLDSRRGVVTMLENGRAWELDLGHVAGGRHSDRDAAADGAIAEGAPPRADDRSLRATAVEGGWDCTFAMPSAEAGTLEAFDVAGRRVAALAVGALAGERTVRLRVEGSHPGLYLVRLTYGGRTTTAKAIRLH